MRAFFQSLTEKQVIVGIVVLTLVVFGPAVMKNQFVTIDDDYLIYDNPAVKTMSLANVKHVFTSYDPQLYIPLTFVSFQLNALLLGMDPVGFHAVNLALHCANAALVLLIARRLTKSLLAASVTAALFALHPLQTEAVLWAASRKDLLSGFFFLLSTLSYLRYVDDGDQRYRRGSVGLYALALLSKVSVILLPLWLLGIDWVRDRPLDRHALTEKIPYGVLAVIFGIIAVVGKSTVLASSGTLVNALLMIKSAAFYLQLMVSPSGFSVIYPYIGTWSYVHEFGPSIAIVLAAIGLLAYFLITGRRLPAFFIGTYFLLLAPSFTTFWKSGYLYFASDRYAYVASIGAFALLGLAIEYLGRRLEERGKDGSPLWIVAAVLVLAFVPFTYAQTKVWRSSIPLYENVLRYHQESVMAETNLGLELQQQGKHAEARAHYERAIAIDPHSIHAYFNLASLAQEEGKESEATALNVAVVDAFGPDQVTSEKDLKPLLWLIDKLDQVGKPGDSFRLAEKLATVAGAFPEPHHAYGVKLRERGDDAQALKEFEAAAAAGSDNAETYYYLTEYYSGAGRMKDAVRVLREGVKLDPKNAFAAQKLRELEGTVR